MQPIRLPPQSPEQIEKLEALYHRTKDVRLRIRAQMMLLAAEKGLVAREIGEIVRADEQTVRRWMKCVMLVQIALLLHIVLLVQSFGLRHLSAFRESR